MVVTMVDGDTLTVRWANREARRMLGEIAGDSLQAAMVSGNIQVRNDGVLPTPEAMRSALRAEIPMGRIRMRTIQNSWRILETTIAALDEEISLVLQTDVTRDPCGGGT